MIVLSPVLLAAPLAALYGAVIGSFLANAVVRLPEDRSLLVPSSCPRCGTRIRWFDNVPVVSWLMLRGRCRHCGQPISAVYPLVEALSTVLAALLARHLFQTPMDLDLAHLVAWVYQFGFVSLLVVAATVDVRHRIIPDETSIYAVPFGILGHVVLNALGYDGWWSIPAGQAVLAAALYGGLFAFMGFATAWWSGLDTLGWGDVKLAAMLGSFLGLSGGLVTLAVSSVLASLVGIVFQLVVWRRAWLPYGPAAAFAAVGVALYGDVPFLRLLVETLRP